MGQKPAGNQFDLVMLTESRLQRLDAVSRTEITNLLGLLLNEVVGLTAKIKEGDDE